MTRNKKTKSAAPQESAEQVAAAEHELRRHAAEWVGAIRTLLTALAQEVDAVNCAVKAGGILAGIIGEEALNEVHLDLYNADCAAGNLSVIGYELPVPNLLAQRDRICGRLTGTKGGA